MEYFDNVSKQERLTMEIVEVGEANTNGPKYKHCDL